MSALRQPNFSTKYYSPTTQLKKINDQRQVVRQPKVHSAKIVKSKAFLASTNLPSNLQALSLLQKGSCGLAIASMAASIGLYISTVHIPKLWSQEYQHLENLQRQERQLVAINETIKYQIAHEAGQDNRLALSKPESAVFINPAKTQVKNQSNISKNKPNTVELKHSSLGY
ncbi:MAG: hypothetical protein WBM44_14690 [Waterburya sp.]